MNNNIRYDLSNRLIHFFREVDTTGSSHVNFPEHWGFDHLVETDVFSPFFLLRSAIRHGRLFATWSIRNNNRTIYGKNPAVCFTEMPLAAFIITSQQRSLIGQAISSYGVTINKSDLYSIGARPVIYGLSTDYINVSTSVKSERLIDEKQLSLEEQYRYVTYNPVGNRKVDWTHEREWRWPFRESIDSYLNEIEESGIIGEIENIPSLVFNQYDFNNMGIIVNTEKEAELVLCDILLEYDRCKHTPYRFVFFTEQISAISSILTPKKEQLEIEKSIIDLSIYITPDLERDNLLYSRFMEILQEVEQDYETIERGEIGGCWLWLYDSLHDLTRALINKDRVEVNNQGKYLCFPFEFKNSRSLAQREKMTEDLASRLKKEFDIDGGYFSVLMSDNYDDVPFYCSDIIDDYEDRLFNSQYYK